MRPPSGRSPAPSSAASTAASSASASLKPSGPNSLMPLSGKGLWEALMTAPAAASETPTSSATAGVGRTPRRPTSAPALASPAASAPSSIGPLRRVSRPIRTRAPSGSRPPSARPIASASSGVRSRLATPRTPSVPNNRRDGGTGAWPGEAGLPLRELRALAGALEAGLLALLDAGVPGEEALLLELGAQRLVGDRQRAGDAVAQGACLAGDAAAVQDRRDVEPALGARRRERHAGLGHQHRAPEELLDGPAVADDLARPRRQRDARDRGLALAGGPVAGGGDVGAHEAASATRVRRSGSGCCAAWGCSGPA